MQNSKPNRQYNWVNTLFLTLTPAIAIVGVPLYLYKYNLTLATFVLFLSYMMITGLAITAGYHRLFSHKTYQTIWPVRLFWLCFGAASFQNSALKWSADHRDHHQYVDTDKDPYSIKEGFWHAHILWVLLKHDGRDYSQVRDLQKDPLVLFQHNHIFVIGAIFGLFLPLFLGSLWGDALGGFLFAGILRIVLNHHFTFFINSMAHYVGTQPYSDETTARDNWFMAFLTYGEGYHNFHHTFPSDYRNGGRAYQWDPAKWLIWSLHKLGFAKGLKKVSPQITILMQVKKQETKLATLFKTKQKFASAEWHNSVLNARERFEDACKHFFALQTDYKKIKHTKMDQWHTRVEKHKTEMRLAKHNFKQSLRQWRRVYKGYRLILQS